MRTDDPFVIPLRQLGLDPDKPFDEWTEEEERILMLDLLEKLQLMRRFRPDDEEFARTAEGFEAIMRRRYGLLE